MTQTSSEYINEERRQYSLYVLTSRAIPHAADGLKASARRILWTARGKGKQKSATLAGATMPIHPHLSPEGTVNTLAAPYGNNIPLLKGHGAFGTLLNPTAYAASRYTSVEISEFTKDVVFRDVEIVPLQENYDSTKQEPIHFLPLIPIVFLNPQEGIAVGFATNILPRSLEDIIVSQITYLSSSVSGNAFPRFEPTNQGVYECFSDNKFLFRGSFITKNSTTLCVTNLPYGLTHEKYVNILNKFLEDGLIQDYIDESRDQFKIIIKFKRGQLKDKTDDEIIELLRLENTETENMTMIDFDGQRVLKTTYSEFIKLFCDWRLQWYKQRYERQAKLLEMDLQRLRDVLLAIAKNVGGIAKKVHSKSELKEFLTAIGIIHVDYIADLQVYRFTQEEKKKANQQLSDGESLLKYYRELLSSESKRREIFINELKEILVHYKKRKYV